MRACYDCLLSYSNQRLHDMIDRHLVRDVMLRLASSVVDRSAVQEQGSFGQPENPGAAQFVTWLSSRGLRLPDAVDSDAEGTRPDLIYDLPDGSAAVFVYGSGADDRGQADRDEQAHEVLRDFGWTVVIIGPSADWAAVAARYPSVFGAQ